MSASVNFSGGISSSVNWGRGGATGSAEKLPPNGPLSGRNPENKLEQDLAAAGVDKETASEIKSELQKLFEDSRATGAPPSNSLKESVNAVFEEYGLEASDFLRPPVGVEGTRGARGVPPSGEASGKGHSEEENLLSIIDRLAETESDPAKFAELAIDVLYGVDAQA